MNSLHRVPLPRRLRRPRSRGQALVEFALVIPIFLVLVIGTFDLGAGVFAYNSVTNAAREGVRLAIVNQSQAAIEQRAMDATAIAETEAPNVVVNFYRPGPNADPTQNPTCSAPIPVGCVAVVSFQTTYRPFTPIIASIIFPTGVTMNARSVLAVEFSCPSGSMTAAQCPKQP
jgi:Flp pilus assembly protein TadG